MKTMDYANDQCQFQKLPRDKMKSKWNNLIFDYH